MKLNSGYKKHFNNNYLINLCKIAWVLFFKVGSRNELKAGIFFQYPLSGYGIKQKVWKL